MEKRYYTCTLLSDVVLNSSLATEGNMSSLDYIPGSNFLGIVAGKLYKENLDKNKALSLFHNGDVKFGDATISNNNQLSYPVPFAYFMDKLENKIGDDFVYLHHQMDKENRPKRQDGKTTAQLKQMRSGYLLSDFTFIKEVNKSFSLKSAQDRNTRNSKDGAMFGFDAMQKGQQFIFSIQYNNLDDAALIESALIGIQRLGKSKNAEYGQVEISPAQNIKECGIFSPENYLLVYAQSHLYLTDEFGQATLQPTAEDLGIEGGRIIWEKSQVRSFSYSPWNGQRKTTSTQRHCIARGSVFYVEFSGEFDQKAAFVGGYQAEGLGKVSYNPIFLENNENKIKNRLTKFSDNKADKHKQSKEPKSTLASFLSRKKSEKEHELKISTQVVQEIETLKLAGSSLIKISASQWGGIRSYATNEKDYKKLEKVLFEKDKGYLTHGVADEKHWGKQGNLKKFKAIFDSNKELGNLFIAKFAAEMAKENKRQEKKK